MNMKKITEAWQKAKQPRTGYSVHIADIYDVFMPGQTKLMFRAAPEKHKSILATLRMIGLEKGAEYTLQKPHMTRRFLMDPDLMKETNHADGPIHASPAIMFTDFTAEYDEDEHPLKSFFGAIITDTLIPEHHDGHCRTKFAIGGYYDRRSRFTVERLMIPRTFNDPASDKKWLTQTDIHEDSIRGALHYARLCTAQMFERETFTPEENFRQSLGPLPDDAMVEINTYERPKFGPK